MRTIRLDLPDGEWADMRTVLTHGQANGLRRAFLRVSQDVTTEPEFNTAVVTAYVEAWSVRGVDGAPLAPSQIDDAPEPVIEAIVAKGLDLWLNRADPNASAAKSTTTLPE
jgi:methyl coenzyme M reductase gamma subunit